MSSPPLARTAWLTVSTLLCCGAANAASGARAEVRLAAGDRLAAPAQIVVERIVDGGERSGGIWARLAGDDSHEHLLRPYGVAWAGDDLLIADPSAGRVVRIDRRGRLTASREGLFSSPIGIASCTAGIVVADSRAGTLSVLDRRLGLVTQMATDLARPTGVACDGDRLFVVETGAHRVLELGSGGGVRRTFGHRGAAPGELNFPVALALADDGLWIGDTLNFRLQRISTNDGSQLAEFGSLGDAPGETPRIKGIAIDPAGRFWVSDAHLDVVALFSATGRLLLEIGGRGAGPGEFSFPAGIAVHADGRVAIADSLNRRVQVLRLVETPETETP